MPLLNKRKFDLMELPEDLEPDEKVFCCSITNEIFRNYEIFYERTILYNSLVWSCDITDKLNLTYQEALYSEERALKKINLIPDVLKKPVFFLVSFVKRSKIDQLKETIFNFVKDRYFIDEEVEVTVGKLRRSDCTILDWQKASQSNDGNDEEAGKDKSLETALDPNEIEYIVRYGTGSDSKVVQLSALCIRRRVPLNRKLCRLLLKANCYKPSKSASEIYHVKEEVLKSFNLTNCSWNKYFSGTPPSFKENKEKSKKNSATNSDSEDKKTSKPCGDDRRQVKEEKIDKKLIEIRKLKEKLKADKQREREEEMVKIKQKRMLLKEKKAAEKREEAEKFKEWSRVREDLECDDLVDLPLATQINLPISAETFGDVLTLMEFFQVFGKNFKLKDYVRSSFNCDTIIDALLSHDHQSALCDFIFFFLSHLISDENFDPEGYEKINIEGSDRALLQSLPNNVTEESLMAFATLAASWSKSYQGYTLNDVELDSYTATEILRLYLLSSARRPRRDVRLWRFQQVGSFSFFDDATISFCLNNPRLLVKLGTTSIYDLTTEEKLSILKCLMEQFLSNFYVREYLDESCDKLQHSKAQFREETFAINRKSKALKKAKAKKEGMVENGNDHKTSDDDTEVVDEEVEADDEDIDVDEKWQKRSEELQIKIARNQGLWKNFCLGKDRFHRRYWSLSWCPGLLVEECLNEEELMFVNDYLPCPMSPVHRWSVYSCVDDLDKLLASLNPRGLRESKLIENLSKMRVELSRRFVQNFKTCRINLKEVWKKPVEAKKKHSMYHLPDSNCSLIGFLRENLLFFENKIFVGSLGCVKVTDRVKWRNLILDGERAAHMIIFDKDETDLNKTGSEDLDVDLDDDDLYFAEKDRILCDPYVRPILTSSHQDTSLDGANSDELRDLISCLLGIERGIDRKFLQPPLGDPVELTNDASEDSKENKKGVPSRYIERWETSLLQCTSVSQIFLHLSTLNRCVWWSKSIANSKCRLCRKKGNEGTMLLCDCCDRGHHMSCLTPPLKQVPSGDWFCPSCRPMFVTNKKQKTKVSHPNLNPRVVLTKTRIAKIESVSSPAESYANNSSPSSRKVKTSKRASSSGRKSVDKKSKLKRKNADRDDVISPKSRLRSSMNKAKMTSSADDGSKRLTKRQRMNGMNKDMELCRDLISDLINHQDSWPFLQPVDAKKVKDYYKIIKQPMDLQTIQKKSNRYANPNELFADVQLVFDNCHHYNSARSEVAKAADSLKEYFLNLVNINSLQSYLPITKGRRSY